MCPASLRSSADCVMQMCDSIPTRAMLEGVGRRSATAGMSMEKRVLSWGVEGRREAREGTVGPSFAVVWVVAWMGMEKWEAKLRSFWVVRTLGDG